ncbi:restriction endonuclease [Methanospirillum lacunae]|uniref:Restriction endonuclease n=1 Tax=Methanospirillum lacunae TaxID=668570 RepID=A0A2V2MRZ9_9EURY|nr:restriction endonuclease [Methanospirillum lacunae]PWR70159.1 restriction endonuclease [Methanospirillum lacunae]
MMIPTYDVLMYPLLQHLSDGQQHTMRDLTEKLAEQYHLNEEERERVLPSGKQKIISSRVGWAKTYLKKAGLITNPGRGIIQITYQGKETLKQNLTELSDEYLDQFESFRAFKRSFNPQKSEHEDIHHKDFPDTRTPPEILTEGYQQIQNELISDLMQQILNCSPRFFESLVLDVLVAMGYGGSHNDAAQSVGRTGDGGIDGIIKEDKLGLDAIFLQAKRWKNSVGRPEIQSFAGALDGVRAKKGIFITTSVFTQDALNYIKGIEKKIVLIDGNQLANLMIEYNVGVSPVATYTIKRVDLDYFEEE